MRRVQKTLNRGKQEMQRVCTVVSTKGRNACVEEIERNRGTRMRKTSNFERIGFQILNKKRMENEY